MHNKFVLADESKEWTLTFSQINQTLISKVFKNHLKYFPFLYSYLGRGCDAHFCHQNGCQDPKQHSFYNNRNYVSVVQARGRGFYGFLIRKYYTIYRITWHSSNVFSDIACVGSSDLSTHSLSHSRNQIALSTPFKTCLQVSIQQTANQSICCYPFTKRLSR